MVKRSEPVNIIKMKKTNHLTKKELEFREEQEKNVLTGTPLQEFPEVKADPVAHEEFMRIRKDFRKIEKSDDLFSGVINRYCMLYSECKDFAKKREDFHKNLLELTAAWEEEKQKPKDEQEMSVFEYMRLKTSIQAQEVALDKQVQKKREMVLAIEKENVMTICAGLKGIPKKPPEEDEEDLSSKIFGGSI